MYQVNRQTIQINWVEDPHPWGQGGRAHRRQRVTSHILRTEQCGLNLNNHCSLLFNRPRFCRDLAFVFGPPSLLCTLYFMEGGRWWSSQPPSSPWIARQHTLYYWRLSPGEPSFQPSCLASCTYINPQVYAWWSWWWWWWLHGASQCNYVLISYPGNGCPRTTWRVGSLFLILLLLFFPTAN